MKEFPSGSDGKESLGQEDPLDKEMATPVFLPGEFHGQRSLVGYSLCGHQESDMTEQLTHFSLSFAHEREAAYHSSSSKMAFAAMRFKCGKQMEILVRALLKRALSDVLPGSNLSGEHRIEIYGKDRLLHLGCGTPRDSSLLCYTSRHLTFKNSLTFSCLTSSPLVRFSYFPSLLC